MNKLRLETNVLQDDKTPSTASPSTKAIDLKKIFTPAQDAEEIVPQKNREYIHILTLSDVFVSFLAY